ncbi:MAG: LuxR C-terminal-related transcriptional regulator [Myxococcaceae bacterium]
MQTKGYFLRVHFFFLHVECVPSDNKLRLGGRSMEMEQQARVAIVHGQSLVRDNLSRVLEGAGLSVVGRHAVPGTFFSSIEQERPSAAVVDLAAFTDNPPDVIAQMSRSHPEVRVVVLSSGDDVGAAQRCFAAGASGLLDRNNAELTLVVQALRAVLRGLKVFPASLLGSAFSQPNEGQMQPQGEQLRTLSAREREVLGYVSGGADNLKIASCLQIAERTVKAHVSALYRKLGQENRTQLALHARSLGVRPPPGI